MKALIAMILSSWSCLAFAAPDRVPDSIPGADRRIVEKPKPSEPWENLPFQTMPIEITFDGKRLAGTLMASSRRNGEVLLASIILSPAEQSRRVSGEFYSDKPEHENSAVVIDGSRDKKTGALLSGKRFVVPGRRVCVVNDAFDDVDVLPEDLPLTAFRINKEKWLEVDEAAIMAILKRHYRPE